MSCLAGRAELDYVQHGVHTVLHVKVGLALRAVAQHMEMIRMFEQLVVKIKHVAMGITLAEDRNEAKYVAFETEPFTVGLNQTLAGELRRAIKRSLNRKGRVL